MGPLNGNSSRKVSNRLYIRPIKGARMGDRSNVCIRVKKTIKNLTRRERQQPNEIEDENTGLGVLAFSPRRLGTHAVAMAR